MSSIPTVNVIKFLDFDGCEISALESYPDTPEGNKEAEATFKRWVESSRTVSDEDMEDYLDDGVCVMGHGGVIITHSTPHPADETGSSGQVV